MQTNVPETRPVWFVTRKYPPRRGGMELLSYEITTRMAQRRMVRIVAAKGGKWGLPWFMLSAAVRLFVGCSRGEVALVHLGDPVLAPLATIARFFGVPVAVTIHGLDITYDVWPYPLLRRTFLRKVDACVFISRATRSAAAECDVGARRTETIGIGVDLSSIPTPKVDRADNLLLFVGRLVKRKGLAWFVGEVLPDLIRDHPKVRLAVIGEGPERKRIEAVASLAGVGDRLLWLGAVPDASKWQWLARATVCVMPNVPVDGDMEGYGIVALEAIACGCPLVAADLEGLRDAVDGFEGSILLPAGDAPGWRLALRALLDDSNARNQVVVDARRWIEAARDWTAIIDRYDRLFSELIAKQSS